MSTEENEQLPSLGMRLRNLMAPTMEDGAATDDVEDIEPWDDETGEPMSGEEGVMPSTFLPDLPDVETGQPALIPYIHEGQVPVELDRPKGWRTMSVDLEETSGRLVAGEQPRRYSLLITNVSGDSVRIGPSQSECFRTIPAGQSYVAEHTAEVWAVGTIGVQTIEVDETLSTRNV